MNRNSRPVYSTESGRLCPNCGIPLSACRCAADKADRVMGDGKVRVSRETKGRKGKGVSIVTGLPLTEDELRRIAKQLKNICGSGGTVKDGAIEIQGDHRDKLVLELTKMGYQARTG